VRACEYEGTSSVAGRAESAVIDLEWSLGIRLRVMHSKRWCARIGIGSEFAAVDTTAIEGRHDSPVDPQPFTATITGSPRIRHEARNSARLPRANGPNAQRSELESVAATLRTDILVALARSRPDSVTV